MKISNSKKQLAKIIHEEGGWVDGAAFYCQDRDGEIFPYNKKPSLPRGGTIWHHSGVISGGSIKRETPIKNWHQTILSRDEYSHLYPAPDAMRPEDFGAVDDCGLPHGSKPTIEQLAADFRNLKDYAARKQQEADAAKADAEAKLAELVAAGKALGLVLGVAEVGFESEFQIRCFRNEKLGLNPKYSNAVRMERCEVCGHRFGLHHGDDNRCPAEGDDDV